MPRRLTALPAESEHPEEEINPPNSFLNNYKVTKKKTALWRGCPI
jgi:hypothetical protein